MFNPFKKFFIKRALKALKEPRPLPLGRQEFEDWSFRIFSLAQVPGLTLESAQFALSEMILHVKPTQSFECDGHFVQSLRKGAANEVAHAIFVELKNARIAKQKGEVLPKVVSQSEQKVLANQTV